MSDETRPEEEVEAHGPLAEAQQPKARGAEAPTAEATDDEPDVEAHGPLGDRDQYGWAQVTERPRDGGPGRRVAPSIRFEGSRGPGPPGPLSFLRPEQSRQVDPGGAARPRAARPRARRPTVASRATTSSSPPPSPRSRSAFRALSSRSTAIAAWFANSPRSSISWRLKSVCSGRSSTESTPSAPSSWRSGAAISPFGHVARALGDIAREPRVVAARPR